MRKIINIIGSNPRYDLYYKEPKPEIHWKTPDGNWVGIWGYDWANLIGAEVMNVTSEFGYEVWQPDLRADKVYSHTFGNGMVHRLFPAVKIRQLYGLKYIEKIVSQSLNGNLLANYQENEIIVHLTGLESRISRSVIGLPVNLPIVVVFFGEVRSPLHKLFKLKKNLLSKYNDIKEHYAWKRMLQKVDLVGYCNERSRVILDGYFNGKMELLPVGIDFCYWKVQSDTRQARVNLGFKDSDFILLSSSRLNSLKQIDKMIQVLENLNHSIRNFQYVVTGHGNSDYERYLSGKGENLIKQGRLKLVGYLPEEKLVEYYTAADLFVITSLSEGAPVSAIKALAMEVPIFSTDTGLVAELLTKYDAGEVVPLKDYKIWSERLRDVIDGRKVKIIRREVVEPLFHWPNVAKRYVNVYRTLFNIHQEKEKT